MNRRIGLLLAVMLIASLLLTGCWSRHELNDLGITLGVGIDKKDDQQYVVSAQLVIPEAVAAKKAGSGAAAVIYKGSGITVAEAFRRMTTVASRSVYLSHLRVLVISEEVARDGIQYILDFFKRNRQLRPDFYVVVSKDVKAEQVLSVLPRLEKEPAERIYRSLEISQKEWSPSSGVFLDELAASIVTKGKDAVLTGVQILGDAEKGNFLSNIDQVTGGTKIKVSTLGIFNKDKLIGWLNEDESKAYNLVTNNVKRTLGWLPCPDGGRGNIGLDIVRSKGTVKGSVRNGKAQIEVRIMQEESVSEVQCDIDLTKPETIYKLEREAEKKVTLFVERMIRKLQMEYKTDILGFGSAIHRSNPRYWAKVEDRWEEEFPKLPVTVKVDIKIRRTGTESNSFITELKKKE
ncbi:Ger(x)C family spore germination protein [Paenibacillus sp. BAC0078]